jgi:hypothetical protein
LSSNRPSDDQQQYHWHNENFIASGERQKLARELQEATAQLRLDELGDLSDGDVAALVAQCNAMVDEIRQEIRALKRG